MADSTSMLTAVMLALDDVRNATGCQDWEIRHGLHAILRGYQAKQQDTGEATDIDFRSPELQCGYLLLYVARHIRLVEDNLDKNWIRKTQLLWSSFNGPTNMVAASLDQWLGAIRASGRGHLRVCCVGGGPGTDLMGLTLLAKKKKWGLPIKGAVLDKWAASWRSVFHHLSARVDPNQTTIKSSNITFCNFDFLELPFSYDVISEVGSADLVTMVKFVSAVSSNREICQRNLQVLLVYMKPGALLFFIDNSGGGFYKLICQVAGSCGLVQVFKDQYKEYCLPPEEVNKWEPFKQRFANTSPEKSLKVSISMWLKPGDIGRGSHPSNPQPTAKATAVRAPTLQLGNRKVQSANVAPKPVPPSELPWRRPENSNVHAASPAFQPPLPSYPRPAVPEPAWQRPSSGNVQAANPSPRPVTRPTSRSLLPDISSHTPTNRNVYSVNNPAPRSIGPPSAVSRPVSKSTTSTRRSTSQSRDVRRPPEAEESGCKCCTIM